MFLEQRFAAEAKRPNGLEIGRVQLARPRHQANDARDRDPDRDALPRYGARREELVAAAGDWAERSAMTQGAVDVHHAQIKGDVRMLGDPIMRLDAERVLDRSDIVIKRGARYDHALGGAGGSRCENDVGELAALSRAPERRFAGQLPDVHDARLWRHGARGVDIVAGYYDHVRSEFSGDERPLCGGRRHVERCVIASPQTHADHCGIGVRTLGQGDQHLRLRVPGHRGGDATCPVL